MKIQYLSDLKNALKDIPEDVLKEIGWGLGEDSEEIGMCVWQLEDGDGFEKWEKYNKKYPQLKDIGKWIENLHKAQKIMESQEPEQTEQFETMEEPIGSNYKFKKF